MANKMTREEAIAFSDSGAWEQMSDTDRSYLQMNQDLLCMPFNVFHESLEKAIGRSVFTHELAVNFDGLREELNSKLKGD